MIVIADTSPINYLVLIEHADVLQALYGRILIPHAVHDELLSPKAPLAVRKWALNLPGCVELLSPSTALQSSIPKLDRGETEAIALAEEMNADWLLIDEAAGRNEAIRRGLRTIGTLGILRDAHRAGLLDLHMAVTRLQLTGFHVCQSFIDDLLKSI
ncbi:MAG: hypothetical protein ABI291_02835 [Acidobacteriaceae bacterium]